MKPIYSKQAAKYLNSLNASAQQRIRNGISKIPKGDIEPYESAKSYYRLRVGKYRVVYKWLDEGQILISIIDTRGQAYKKGAIK